MIDNKWGTYALYTVLLSYPYCHAILVAWTSKNSNNVGTRSVSAALYNVGCFAYSAMTQNPPQLSCANSGTQKCGILI